MTKFFDFFQDLFLMKKDNGIKIGLSQFKRPVQTPIKKDVSLHTKDVKLSDLMRRAS